MSERQHSLVSGKFLSESNPIVDIAMQWVLFVLGLLALMPIWSDALPKIDTLIFGFDATLPATFLLGFGMAILVHQIKVALDSQ